MYKRLESVRVAVHPTCIPYLVGDPFMLDASGLPDENLDIRCAFLKCVGKGSYIRWTGLLPATLHRAKAKGTGQITIDSMPTSLLLQTKRSEDISVSVMIRYTAHRQYSVTVGTADFPAHRLGVWVEPVTEGTRLRLVSAVTRESTVMIRFDNEERREVCLRRDEYTTIPEQRRIEGSYSLGFDVRLRDGTTLHYGVCACPVWNRSRTHGRDDTLILSPQKCEPLALIEACMRYTFTTQRAPTVPVFFPCSPYLSDVDEEET